MNRTPVDPDDHHAPSQAQLQASSRRRTRRFFRRAAIAAAAACALAAAVEFWPVAYDVARFSDLSTSAGAGTGSWNGVGVLLLFVVSGAAALAGALAVLTVGWWVQMRMSQAHSRPRGSGVTTPVPDQVPASAGARPAPPAAPPPGRPPEPRAREDDGVSDAEHDGVRRRRRRTSSEAPDASAVSPVVGDDAPPAQDTEERSGPTERDDLRSVRVHRHREERETEAPVSSPAPKARALP